MKVTMETSIQRNNVFNVLRKDDYKSRNIFTKISLKNKSEMTFFFKREREYKFVTNDSERCASGKRKAIVDG